MEPASIAAAVVAYIVSEFRNNEGLKKASNELSSAIWGWVRPLFLKDEQPLIDLKSNPSDVLNQQDVQNKIHKAIIKDPEMAQSLLDLLNHKELGNSNIINQISTGTGDNVGGNKYVL